jgi:maleate isomerase
MPLKPHSYGTDLYGRRRKFAVLVPSTNTAVEMEYHLMRPEGVVLATRACVIPPMKVQTEEDFVALVHAIGTATEQGLRDALTCQPQHVIFGYSAETFWEGKARSDREFKRYNDIALEAGGCSITFGAQALQDALACYPGVRRVGVITPYMPVGDRNVTKFLGDIGYEVVRIEGHRSPGAIEIAHESFAKTRALVKAVDGDDVDLILQAGTNLYFAELAAQMEQELGKPVISINTLTFWHALRHNGIDDRIRGFGSLLSEH